MVFATSSLSLEVELLAFCPFSCDMHVLALLPMSGWLSAWTVSDETL